MSTLLKTEHLKKYYGKKKIVKAVDDVSLEIHAGSSMALIGESGSGKTTFGKLIAGLEKPTDGKFWFQGQEMQDLSEKQFRPYRKNLQMVFQSSSGVFDPGYTIGENILEILKLHEKLQEGEYEERVKEALIQTGSRSIRQRMKYLEIDPVLIIAHPKKKRFFVRNIKSAAGCACFFLYHCRNITSLQIKPEQSLS